ncbi:hypothetical protein ASG60_08060 [Methylobacterium sp. Leaf469]|nr:hypothetical protein ASG60_08060 [Methylobacterium sp. Leaf469]
MPVGPEPATVLTSVLMSPAVSAAVATGSTPERAEVVRLVKAGVLVFLTACEARSADAVVAWMRAPEGVAEGDGVLLRVVTPGAYLWPRDTVPMPLGAALDDQGLATVRGIVEALVEEVNVAGMVPEVGAGFVCIGAGGALPSELVGQIWHRCARADIALGLEGRTLEANPSLDGQGRVTVVAPETPSEAWFTAVTRAERIDPRSLLIVRRMGEAEHASLDAFRSLLSTARKALDVPGAPPECVADASGSECAVLVPADHVLAPRIAVPSDVHFIERWTEANRSYVREHYWRATETGRSNRRAAEGILVKLEPKRHARAADLVRLAGLDDGRRMFDDYSGAVCFDPGYYEFEIPRPTDDRAVDMLVRELREYFDDKLGAMPFDRPLLRRRLYTNSLVLLRGDAYYANLKQIPPWEKADDYIHEAEVLEALFRRLLGEVWFDGAVRACAEGGSKTEKCWKLLVGTMDQARNLGLVLYSVAAHRWRDNRRQTEQRDLLSAATGLVKAYYRVLLGDAELTATDLAQEIISGAIRAASELRALRSDEENRARSADWYDPDKPIRNWREADDPYENLLLGLLAVEGIGERDDTVALGLFWGGVELPVVAAVAAEVTGKRLATWGFLSHGRYSSAASQDGDHFCDLSNSCWSDIAGLGRADTGKVLLMDDNALSGGTLESARDLLFRRGVTEVETWVVRFSGERREGQMRMDKGGTVEPAYMDRRLKGFLGETPYARSYSRKRYESPVGVFNTARSRILRYLHNNSFASKFEREGF